MNTFIAIIISGYIFLTRFSTHSDTHTTRSGLALAQIFYNVIQIYVGQLQS
jgi:hypothetical protein